MNVNQGLIMLQSSEVLNSKRIIYKHGAGEPLCWVRVQDLKRIGRGRLHIRADGAFKVPEASVFFDQMRKKNCLDRMRIMSRCRMEEPIKL